VGRGSFDERIAVALVFFFFFERLTRVFFRTFFFVGGESTYSQNSSNFLDVKEKYE
jgi:hypothetical protein